MKLFTNFLLMAITLYFVQAEESEKYQDCSLESTLVGTLTVGIVLYYVTLPIFWVIGSTASFILGPFYAPISSIFGIIFPFASYVYLVGLLVPNEEIAQQMRSAASKIFSIQDISLEK